MDYSYVALCGVAEHALMQLLNDAPHISQIALCLDHDKAGNPGKGTDKEKPV